MMMARTERGSLLFRRKYLGRQAKERFLNATQGRASPGALWDGADVGLPKYGYTVKPVLED